jgi:hypothetical protein
MAMSPYVSPLTSIVHRQPLADDTSQRVTADKASSNSGSAALTIQTPASAARRDYNADPCLARHGPLVCPSEVTTWPRRRSYL